MPIKKGDYVTRESYNNDTVFKVINIKDNLYYLKGVEVRLLADSPLDDLKKYIEEEKSELDEIDIKDSLLTRNDYFYLPAKILHIDADITLCNHLESFIIQII